MNIEKIDKTIDDVCDWIQKEISEHDANFVNETVGMVNALASLVEARAKHSVKESYLSRSSNKV